MPERTSTRRRFLALCGALTAGLAGCGRPFASGRESTRTPRPPTATSTPSTAASPTATPATDSSSAPERSPPDSSASPYTRVYRDVIGSVVLVDTGRGQGTGFAFDGSHVVTNAHVVGGVQSTHLRFNQGDWRRGEVVGTDPHSDLAAIEVPSVPSPASPLPFLDGVPTVGQEVVAIGNPFSLNGSLTTGVVSGTDRLIPAPTGFRIPDAIQTDAAVNPGNSGGPLVSLDGSVVGVVSSKRGDNVAFGISAALTRRVVPELIQTGEYDHAYMGVQYSPVTPTIAAANDMARPRGVIVVRTVPRSPADDLLRDSEIRFGEGVRVPVGGDVILAIDGTPVATTEDLASHLALRARPGDSARFKILRNGTEQTVELELGTRPDQSGGELIR